ncbi:hypothetical protein [Zooshikella harenae]|uniref:Uncharacterized protein n=1 Tax=Zooshikella harenae TaxID=2827238 RepID=A0ABS5ZB86_9GAMM|nr:hypothetical protein [Zooshikella harenae]MBU2710505.1 hypothetical protein [Zooshikella harenae]
MAAFNLRKLDLNLLTVLEQLLDCRHVSQAASAPQYESTCSKPSVGSFT